MRRELKIILTTLFLAGLWAGASRLPAWLHDQGFFLVREVEVRGVRFMEPAEVRSLLALDPDASLWDDADVWEERVEAHDLVAEARIRRRMPGTLVVEVAERQPVALVATPLLEPVDAEGVLLPLDPAETRLDLPVVAGRGTVADGSRLVPAGTRELVDEVARLMEGDTAFLQMVSEVRWGPDHTLVARWAEPRVDFLLHPGTPVHRFREGLQALAHAMSQDPGVPPHVVDLRFADQVVVRRSPQE